MAARRESVEKSSSGVVMVAAILLVMLGATAGGVYLWRRNRPDPQGDACVASTGRLIREMKNPVEIDVWVTGGSRKRDRLRHDLAYLLDRYREASGGKLQVRIVDAQTEDDLAAATAAGLQLVPFEDPERPGIVRGVAGLVVQSGGERQAIPQISPDQAVGLPFWITNKIREVRARAENRHQRIGVLAGKGGIKLSDANLVPRTPGIGSGAAGPSLQGIMEQAMPFYRFEEVDLQGGEASIDPALTSLVVTQPGEDFTDRELARIDEFVMRGHKGLAVFASAVSVAAGDPAMHAYLSTHALEKLLAGYGVEMKSDVVLDEGPKLRVITKGAGVERAMPALLIARSGGEEGTLDSSFVPFFRLEDLTIPFASTLVAHPERQPGATVRIVARSTPGATVVTGVTGAIGEMPLMTATRIEGRDPGQRAVAVGVWGSVRSAFGPTTAPETRILVISSSQFTANPMVRSGPSEELDALAQSYAMNNMTATIIAFKNTLDWMSEDENVAACSPR